MAKARIALIGCGIIGNHHYNQFQKCLDIAEIMDMSFAIQALSAKYLAENAETICREPGHMVNDVPLEIDQEVARRKLSYWGCEIDTLTPEQHRYLFGE